MATDTTIPVDAGAAPEQDDLSLRDTLDAAFEQHATDEVDAPAGERARDDLGRFAKAPPAPAQPEPTAKAPAGPQEAPSAAGGIHTPKPAAAAPAGPAGAPAAPDLKAPVSWTPAAREKWAGVDPEIRAEIHRREAEGQRVLQESAGLRQFAQAFHDTVRPYESFIAAENSDPLRAVASLMNTAAQLRVGSAQTKAEIVANIVRAHDIPLELLDSTLARLFNAQPGQPVQQPAARDPRVDQMWNYQQQQAMAQQQEAAQREAWENQQISEGLAQFAATHEFYFDVKETMADLVDAATRRGQAVDLEKVYARACQLDEQVSTILSQRAAAQRGTPPAVLRAKRAAASVKGDPTPHGATVPKDDSVRSAIEAAFDAHST